jgi:hypothetical protein
MVVTGADRRAPRDRQKAIRLRGAGVARCRLRRVRSRLNLGTMAIATMIAGSPFLAWLNGFCVGQTILSARAGRIACATPFHPSR